jgi:hypothetical protein
MPTDTETGITPVAADGEPNAASLDAKRAAKTNGNGGGGSMADRAAALESEQQALDAEDGKPQEGEEDDGQLFVWEQGRKVTLGTLIARGIPIEHAFVFGGKRLKGRGQLMAFEDDAVIVGRGKVEKVSIVPTRDGDEKITKATIETHIALKVVVPANSDEAAGLLRGTYERAGD